MQTTSDFNRSTAFALALMGCTTGGATDGQGDDGQGDDGETATETSSSETSGASSPSTSTSSTSSTSDTGIGETDGGSCEHNDDWEPNHAMKPSMVNWQTVSEWSAFRMLDDAYLCAGEGDWYQFDVASLGYAEHFLYLRALVEDAGLCGAQCDQPVLPAGPEYAMTVEVYRPDGMQLLLSTTDDDGVLPLGGFGDDYAHDLLIHVFSLNPKAEYSYRLSVEVRNYDGEDECEC